MLMMISIYVWEVALFCVCSVFGTSENEIFTGTKYACKFQEAPVWAVSKLVLVCRPALLFYTTWYTHTCFMNLSPKTASLLFWWTLHAAQSEFFQAVKSLAIWQTCPYSNYRDIDFSWLGEIKLFLWFSLGWERIFKIIKKKEEEEKKSTWADWK